MESSETTKIISHYQITYDQQLDEVLENPLKFNLSNKYEKVLAEQGNYLKLDKKNIWLQFHYENSYRCRLVAYIEGNLFKIWSIISTPKRIGVASRTLEFINGKIKDGNIKLSLYAVDVWTVAIEFWEKMKKNKLIAGFEKHRVVI